MNRIFRESSASQLFNDLNDTFWLVPALMVVGDVVMALGMLQLDRSELVPRWLLEDWLYDGSGTGARTLLGTVASSTIGVAGTVFSIAIAVLSLAAGQMGPRLLRNFTRDRGNQFTLGAFLATFSYALIVLRSVRTQDEGAFVPHLALSVSILMAFVCVAMLVHFVGHMAGRINVDTVIELVSDEVQSAMRRLTAEEPRPDPPPYLFWADATAVIDPRRGYLQHLDDKGLADWAAKHKTAIRLLVRPGDFVFPGVAIAVMMPPVADADDAIRTATVLGAQRVSSADLEFAVRQLVDVAVRALSPGINDPHTAMSVVDRLGAALCEIVPRHLPTGVLLRDERVVLAMPSVNCQGLLDAMFHMIRQNASGGAAVLIRMLDVLTAAARVERDYHRMRHLGRHADLIAGDADHNISTPSDLADIRARHTAFLTMREHGPLGQFRAVQIV
ncbi:DUF2254 domain-containing protein [Tardiphaga sp. vice278]|uniref:DUF2254 domain-containing protein n=1 Tax=Tardiphaga sp. vice278 TaxID=2592815 RepID=UPI0011646DA5|nr:DUF2254 domain-containing protein [Tardiphaga sp. vice278]QDM19173.1 DUF2254 domain-containing protein [Tardiphaga sp. vice278]